MRAVAEVPENHPAFAQPSEPTPPVSEVQTSAPAESVPEPEPVAEPESPKEPVAAAPVESEDAIEEGAVYFRKKDGTFRKATKKEALGEMHSRINTLTGRLRGTEEELQRVRQTAPVPRPEPESPQQPAVAQPRVSSDPRDPKPIFDERYQSAPGDPYAVYLEDLSAWSTRESHRTIGRQSAQQQQEQIFRERTNAFVAEHPDYNEVIVAANLDVTPALDYIIKTDEQGPAIAYYLGSNPEHALQLIVDTLKITEAGPALEVVRRLIHSRMSAAGSTGSARPAVRSSAPPPLNPVRTVSPALDEPPLTGNESFSEFVRKGNDQDRKRRESRFGA